VGGGGGGCFWGGGGGGGRSDVRKRKSIASRVENQFTNPR